MNDNERSSKQNNTDEPTNQIVRELINQPGAIGEEELPAVDVGKTDKAPWTLDDTKSETDESAKESDHEHWPPFAGL